MSLLTKERKGEIGDVLFTEFLRKERITLSKNEFERKIGNLSKKVNISKDELRAYLKEKIELFTSEMFS